MDVTVLTITQYLRQPCHTTQLTLNRLLTALKQECLTFSSSFIDTQYSQGGAPPGVAKWYICGASGVCRRNADVHCFHCRALNTKSML